MIDLKDNSKIQKQMDSVYIFIAMELYIKEIGCMICLMVLEKKHGQMVQNIKGIFTKAKDMVKVPILCLVEHLIQDNGNKVK